MQIFVPRETVEGETRVAAVPETVKKLIKADVTVQVESGAGAASSLPDAEYEKAGASIAANAASGYGAADVVIRFHPPSDGEIEAMKEGTTLISFVYPMSDPAMAKKLADRKIQTFAMDLVPRISRAQKMDALSSQSNIAGYKGVIMAAEHLQKMFPLMMTAAGTLKPARVVILGAGVAGLQAIATAKRLGAVVEVSDIRPAVKEQVESLGGRFIDVGTSEESEDAGGYAKEASEDFKRRQEEAVTQRLAEADVAITTALIPGRPAPKLISEEMVKGMPEGSVIVDLAAEQGGNCALTKPGEIHVAHGVKIIGLKYVPALVPLHASEMYSKNVLFLLQHLLADGKLNVDLEDEITAGSLVTRDGNVTHEGTVQRLAEGGNS